MQPRLICNWMIAGTLLVLAGCVADDSAARDAGTLAAVEARDPGTPEVWLARSPRGIEVRVKPNAYPLRSGEVELNIEIDGTATDQAVPVSVDLASPTMPMHGIMRFPVRQTGAGQYITVVEIPMEGRWSLYVNLNEDGTEAAEFEFDVMSADSMTHVHDPNTHSH